MITIALALSILAPLCSVALMGFLSLARTHAPSESATARIIGLGLLVSMTGSVMVLFVFLGLFGAPVTGEVELGDWLRIGDFVIPAVLLIDRISVTISLFAAFLTALVARFSRTYLHKEAGFNRFFTDRKSVV